MLTPFLSLINIIVLGYIAYAVHEYEDLSKLNDFRYRAYIELTNKLDDLKEESLKAEDVVSVESFLKSFRFNNLFLFDGAMEEIFRQRVTGVLSSVTSLRNELQVEEQFKKKE